MKLYSVGVIFQANAAEPALRGRRYCPLQGLSAAALDLPAQIRTARRAAACDCHPWAASGRFGGEPIHG